MMEITDYELGQRLTAQKELLMQAYETGNNKSIEHAITRVTTVRGMKRNGTLEWQKSEV